MSLVSPLRASARPNVLKIFHAGGALQASSCRDTRLFSSFTERGRYIHACSKPRTVTSSRSYWWSSSTPPAPSLSPVEPATLHDAPLPPSPSTSEPLASTISSQPPTSSIVEDSITVTQGSSVNDVANLPVLGADAITPETLGNSLPGIIPSLQYGDLAQLGFDSWWSVPDWVVRSFGAIQVTTGLPWFYTIIAGTIVWRTAVVYWQIPTLRTSANVRIHAEPIAKAQADMQAIKGSGGSREEVLAAGQKVRQVYKDHGISMFAPVISAVTQIPVVFGLFLGTRRMCDLPVEQLKESGVSWIPDLTMISGSEAFDPYYIMPLLTVASINVQMFLMRRDTFDPTKPAGGHLANVFRLASPLMLYFFSGFPAGLQLSIITGIVFSALQSAVFRLRWVRQKLNIPFLQSAKPPTLGETRIYAVKRFREFYAESGARAREAQAARAPSAPRARPKIVPRRKEPAAL